MQCDKLKAYIQHTFNIIHCHHIIRKTAKHWQKGNEYLCYSSTASSRSISAALGASLHIVLPGHHPFSIFRQCFRFSSGM
uniref:Uncharacterized protein n=1 Tax=Arundo donax TaxID=35708 RepID=A0A0A9EZB6_ARUDO